MQKLRPSLRLLLVLPCGMLLLALGACGTANATPTESLDAIYTAAAQTFEAQRTADAALTPPTATPTDTPIPTLALPTAPPPLVNPISFPSPTGIGVGGTSNCDNSQLAADVTFPDNAPVDAGKKFTKTWQLINNGTCGWTTSYQLIFLDGTQMAGLPVFLSQDVPVGRLINVSVNLQAPEEPGQYYGRWRMKNASGQHFGAILTVVIKVPTP